MRGWERDVLPHAGVGEEGKDAGGGILRMGFEEVALGEVGEEEDWGAAEREGDGARDRMTERGSERRNENVFRALACA